MNPRTMLATGAMALVGVVTPARALQDPTQPPLPQEAAGTAAELPASRLQSVLISSGRKIAVIGATAAGLEDPWATAEDPMLPGEVITNIETVQTPENVALTRVQHLVYTRDVTGAALTGHDHHRARVAPLAREGRGDRRYGIDLPERAAAGTLPAPRTPWGHPRPRCHPGDIRRRRVYRCGRPPR